MYNASGTAAAGSGAMLAMVGVGDSLGLVTGLAFVGIALGGIFMLHGSRKSRRDVNSEMG